jgi:16S rRNA (cytosine967-C5)-methyltransferase
MMPYNVRKSAVDVLNIIDQGHRTLDSVLEDYSGVKISKPDRALFQALVYGVLRWRGRLDYIISRFSKTRFKKIHPEVLNILRLALFQIIYLDRVPVSAAVNTAVELAKKRGAPWVVGYVNGVLRNAARDYRNISFSGLKKDPVAALAVEKSFPEWIVRRWYGRYGPDATASLCDSQNTIPPLTIRTNTIKTTPQKLIDALKAEAGHIKPTPYAPHGITLSNPAAPIAELKAFEAGWFQVQDEAAQLVSLLLDPQPGETVLDACAGLGGKTGHIAQLMEDKGALMAVDANEGKLIRLKAEMQRLGISIVTSQCHNLDNDQSCSQLPKFDRILLDAPCSGLGVIRRNPDIKWRSAKMNLEKYKTRQLRLLNNLSHLVNPPGVLVYAVCSPEPDETEAVINEFLKNTPEFAISREFGQIPAELCSMAEGPGRLKTFPRLNQMDGFYAVRLQRKL